MLQTIFNLQHLKIISKFNGFIYISGLVAQWITRLPTEQKIAGSSPAEVENPFLKTTIQRLKY